MKAIAEILQSGDLTNTESMLRKWKKVRAPKPKPLGRNPRDRRDYLYEPSAIVAWVKKVEGYLTVKEDDIVKRLARLAVEAENGEPGA